jgi:hypothetical protein
MRLYWIERRILYLFNFKEIWELLERLGALRIEMLLVFIGIHTIENLFKFEDFDKYSDIK